MQSALLAELNKHSPESVIRRFEERSHAVDSKGVAEYLRALVVTNALAEYLPYQRLGKPFSLPTLLQELKQRASGKNEEALLNPGVSETQPLHVVVVDPKASNRSTRFAQELVSTILFTIVVGLMWVIGASALQKYVGSLGGIGTSGVGSSATYVSKDLNKEIMPEKHENSLHALANALLEYETLSADDIKQILNPFRGVELSEQDEELALT